MTSEGLETERTGVKTYVPEFQKERWQEDADAMDMNQSEFIRTMVQAGRRGFDLGAESEEAAEDELSDADPRGDGLETVLLGLLSTDRYLSWGALVDEVTEDLEDRVETALQDLVAEGRVQHSPRRGGYVRVEAEEGADE